nr:MAG TPA: hypothetical protein [Caudoviricetes sp.]
MGFVVVKIHIYNHHILFILTIYCKLQHFLFN